MNGVVQFTYKHNVFYYAKVSCCITNWISVHYIEVMQLLRRQPHISVCTVAYSLLLDLKFSCRKAIIIANQRDFLVGKLNLGSASAIGDLKSLSSTILRGWKSLKTFSTVLLVSS